MKCFHFPWKIPHLFKNRRTKIYLAKSLKYFIFLWQHFYICSFAFFFLYLYWNVLFQYNLTAITHISDILYWHNCCLIIYPINWVQILSFTWAAQMNWRHEGLCLIYKQNFFSLSRTKCNFCIMIMILMFLFIHF